MSEVVSIFSKKKEKSEKKDGESFDFNEIMKLNKQNSERLSKDRNKHNNGVTRSYRLKKGK